MNCADYTKSAEQNGADSPIDDAMEKLDLNQAENLHGSDLCSTKGQSDLRYQYHLVYLTTQVFRKPFPFQTFARMFFSGSESLTIGWQNYGVVELKD